MGEKRTITLTDRQPVTVDTEVWPIIASAKDHDNQYEAQANRKWSLVVRQCQTEGDDRCIVYGVYTSQWQNEPDLRGGEIVDSVEEVPASVKRVAEYLGFERTLADACVADLPAVEL